MLEIPTRTRKMLKFIKFIRFSMKTLIYQKKMTNQKKNKKENGRKRNKNAEK